MRLDELEREAGREAQLVPLSADLFPAPDPAGTVVAVSLGHLGRRTDWALLRAVTERMPELVLLLVGAWHDDEVTGDEDYAACRAAPNVVWLGEQPDEEAARLILCADVGIVPFKVEPFNDAGLPYRILKYARLGRRTVAPAAGGRRHLVGGGDHGRRTPTHWSPRCAPRPAPACGPGRPGCARGRSRRPRSHQNAPLWERLRELGIVSADPDTPRTR